MASVLNKTTKEYRQSANTPDFPTSDWIINPDLSAIAGVPMEYWKVVGDSVVEMNQSEKDAVDAVIIDQEKADKITQYSVIATHIVESNFAPSVMTAFSILLSQASVAGLANRAAYIMQLINWGFVVQGTYEAKKAEINSKTTRNDVANVTWDTSGLLTAKPDVSLAGAMAITN
jgi:hypothetical protein